MSESTSGIGKYVPPNRRPGAKLTEAPAPKTTEERFLAWLAELSHLPGGVTIVFVGLFGSDNYRFKLLQKFEFKTVEFNIHYNKGPHGGEMRCGSAWVIGIHGMSVSEFAGSNYLRSLAPKQKTDLVENHSYSGTGL